MYFGAIFRLRSPKSRGEKGQKLVSNVSFIQENTRPPPPPELSNISFT